MTPKSLALALLLTSTLLATPSRASPLRDVLGPYSLQVLVNGRPARTFQKGGQTYVLGQLGARYVLRVWNRSGRRVEADVSVDGRDVLTGKPADFQTQRGYLIPAWGHVDIDGWRISESQAAAFRFSSVPDSYAARTGSAREVGVIGVAIFPERRLPPPRPVYDTGAIPPEAAPPPPTRGLSRATRAPGAREGLATRFGEAVDSPVTEVPFERQDPFSPSAILGLRYDDARGLLAMGIDVNASRRLTEAQLRETADPFPRVDPRYAQPPPGWTP